MKSYREYIFEEIHKRGLQFLLTGQDKEEYLRWLKLNKSSEQTQKEKTQ